jgi:hypothetical protein
MIFIEPLHFARSCPLRSGKRPDAKDLLREIRVKFVRDKIIEAHPGLLL